MIIDINSMPIVAIGFGLLACCAIGIVYGIRRFSRADWIACALGIVGLSTLILGTARVFAKDGCHSGLHGIPVLQHTESIYPYFSIALILVAIAVNLYGNWKNKNT